MLNDSEIRSPSKTKYIITYDKFISMINDLTAQIADYIRTHYGIYYLLPIIRGGLIPATYLSHKLNIPIITLYDVYKNLGGGGSKIIIVEDVIDTGRTMQKPFWKILREYDNIKVASLITKTWTPEDVKPDFCVEVCNNWVVFPWEEQ